MYSDSIADMLTRIRNGYMAKKKEVIIPYSRMKENIVNILVKNHYLKETQVLKENKKQYLKVSLEYLKGNPAIRNISRVSKSGRRIYRDKKNLPYVLSGLGMAIISTSQGILTADEARKKSLGGEVVCYVW